MEKNFDFSKKFLVNLMSVIFEVQLVHGGMRPNVKRVSAFQRVPAARNLRSSTRSPIQPETKSLIG